MEVYARGDGAAGEPGIALCKDGTRVLGRITELLPFQGPPWDDRRLEGLLDFEPLALAPGTRSGIIADAALEALVAAAAEIARDVGAALETRERAETERASRQILKQVHKAFASALADLPAEDYLFFDIPQQAAALQERGEPAASGAPLRPGRRAAPEAPPEAGAAPALFPPEPGPLAAVRIAPRQPRRPPGGSCRLVATACDEAGVAIPAGVAFAWRIAAGSGVLAADAAACTVRADAVGLVRVEVTARQWMIAATAAVDVKFLDDAGGDGGGRGLPGYRLEPDHGGAWRSRYDAARNEIVINSAHRDFVASRNSVGRHRRYIGKLYAKEVVLTNFPHESPAEVMERLIEITLRTEDAL